MYYSIQHAFAGLWPLVWHWGTAVGIIILCLIGEAVIAYFASTVPFVEKWLKPLQMDLIWVALGAGLYLYALNTGINIEAARSKAQQAIIQRQVDEVVDDVLKDPRNQPHTVKKGQKAIPPHDRWDNPEN